MDVPGSGDGWIVSGISIRPSNCLIIRRTLDKSHSKTLLTLLQPSKPLRFAVKRDPAVLDSEFGTCCLGCDGSGQSRCTDVSDCWSDLCSAIENGCERKNETACCSDYGGLQDRGGGDDQVNCKKIVGRSGGNSSWDDGFRRNY